MSSGIPSNAKLFDVTLQYNKTVFKKPQSFIKQVNEVMEKTNLKILFIEKPNEELKSIQGIGTFIKLECQVSDSELVNQKALLNKLRDVLTENKLLSKANNYTYEKIEVVPIKDIPQPLIEKESQQNIIKVTHQNIPEIASQKKSELLQDDEQNFQKVLEMSKIDIIQLTQQTTSSNQIFTRNSNEEQINLSSSSRLQASCMNTNKENSINDLTFKQVNQRSRVVIQNDVNNNEKEDFQKQLSQMQSELNNQKDSISELQNKNILLTTACEKKDIEIQELKELIKTLQLSLQSQKEDMLTTDTD